MLKVCSWVAGAQIVQEIKVMRSAVSTREREKAERATLVEQEKLIKSKVRLLLYQTFQFSFLFRKLEVLHNENLSHGRRLNLLLYLLFSVEMYEICQISVPEMRIHGN